ncbi:MAG: hypothetical protein LBP53_06260 [Candidatus Peribacteria bacterium]|nr:hypothetical protein [Candidatus Peribacteria bacterium]
MLFSVVVFAVACYHKFSSPAENAEIDYPIPENAEVVVGDVGPVNFPNANKTTQDDDVKFGITNSARAFYLPKNIHTDHPEYYDLLTTDRKPNILKLTLGNDGEHKGTPIINVELPNEEEYFRAKAMWEY